MNKMQAYNEFWNSFGLIAYDENTVPDNAEMPYITYEASSDDFGQSIALTSSIWYHSTSWTGITAMEMRIADEIGRGGKLVSYDGGAFWIRKGNPWAQRMSDESSDSIRRIVLNLEVEFLD